LVEKAQYQELEKELEKELVGDLKCIFEGRVRYLASSLIVTIPVRVARELGLELGDKVIVNLRRRRTVSENPS